MSYKFVKVSLNRLHNMAKGFVYFKSIISAKILKILKISLPVKIFEGVLFNEATFYRCCASALSSGWPVLLLASACLLVLLYR